MWSGFDSMSTVGSLFNWLLPYYSEAFCSDTLHVVFYLTSIGCILELNWLMQLHLNILHYSEKKYLMTTIAISSCLLQTNDLDPRQYVAVHVYTL